MILSLNWLGTHVDLEGLSVADIERLLTFAGVEVERVTAKGVASDQVVVAQILEFTQHPDADRLAVCQVDGGAAVPFQIVCGAKNFKAGDKVPLAKDGAVLPGDFKIKVGKLRGVESQGMMCSGKELGLTQDSDGLLILPPDAPVGQPLSALLGSDTVMEIEVTPNRPDWLSHRGVAREISVLTGRPLKAAEALPTMPVQPAAADLVRVEDTERCPAYTARIIRGVTVKPSAPWLRERIESIGLRSINNVVDITNFVLHAVGQPLHAFDLGKLTGGLIVRRATEGEGFTALDGKEFALTPDDLVIADQARPQALAGVMGGALSAVTEETTDLLIESARFAPTAIRRTSRRHSLTSDSCYRFERGTDLGGVLPASALATVLILQEAGGIAEDVVSAVGETQVAPEALPVIALDPEHVARLIGTEIPTAEIDRILTTLGLIRTPAGWQVPSFRGDLHRPVDLIEEVARIAGLDCVPGRTQGLFLPASAADASYDFAHGLKSKLTALGYLEARTIKLVSDAQLTDALGFSTRPGAPLPLKNPLSTDHTHLRPSLIPGLLQTAAHNVRQGAEALRFFEMGTIFSTTRNPKLAADEGQSLGILLSGPHVPSSWLKKAPFATDIADWHGLIEAILPIEGLKFRPTTHPLLVVAAEIVLGGKVLGLGGIVVPARTRETSARHPIFVAEFSLAQLESQLTRPIRATPLPRFPSMTRDIALEVPASVTAGQFGDFFAKHKEPLLIETALFDVFRDASGEKLAADKKSLAFTLTYREPTRTLEAKEVDAAHQRLVEALKKALPVSVR
jgi:phenylalanyl-tRNA synthetase beta chain